MFISLNNLFSAPFFAYSAAIASIHPSKVARLTLQNPSLTSLSSFRYEASLFKGARLPLAAQIAWWLEVRSVVWWGIFVFRLLCLIASSLILSLLIPMKQTSHIANRSPVRLQFKGLSLTFQLLSIKVFFHLFKSFFFSFEGWGYNFVPVGSYI